MLHGWPFINLRNVFAILLCILYIFYIGYIKIYILQTMFNNTYSILQYAVLLFQTLIFIFWSGCTVWLVDENVNVIFATFYRLQSPAPQDQPEEKEDRDHKLERTRSAGTELLFQFLFKCLIETQYISLKSKWPFVCFMNLISYI